MKSIVRSICAVTLLSSPFASIGQVSSADCKAIADTVAAGYSTTLTQSQLEQLKYYANCEASSSSQNIGVDFLYSGFSLGAKYDEAKRNSSCTTDASKLNLQNLEYTRVKQVYRDGLEVVSQCLQLAARNWSIKFQLYKDAVSFSIANLSPNGNELRGIDIIGSENLTCKDLPAKYPLTVTASGLSSTCIRVPRTQTVGGTVLTESAESVINLRLADGPFVIKLPGYSSSVLDGVKGEISAMRVDVKKLRDNIKKGGGKDIPASGGNAVGAACPAGSYMVGTRFQIDSGGRHGIISNIFPVCQQINSELE